MDKKKLTERDICTKYILPAIKKAGWDIHTQIREEVTLTAGRVIVRGQMGLRSKGKRADFVLYHKPNMPLAIIEAKKNTLPIAAGMQQGLSYAELLEVPFIFSSNGDGFIFHDKTSLYSQVEQELSLDEFPSHTELWQKYQEWKGYQTQELETITSYSESKCFILKNGYPLNTEQYSYLTISQAKDLRLSFVNNESAQAFSLF